MYKIMNVSTKQTRNVEEIPSRVCNYSNLNRAILIHSLEMYKELVIRLESLSSEFCIAVLLLNRVYF